MNLQQVEYYEKFDTTKGVYYIQQERVDELNTRILDRQFPDVALEPHYDPRPVPTKFSYFPIIDRKKPMKETAKSYGEYKVDDTFAPMTDKAPFSGYVNNIDKEMALRNQYFALQRNTPQSQYIPSTESDLYNVTIVSKPSEQPFKDLFSPNKFDNTPHPNIASAGLSIGNDTFFNHTRTQLRNNI